MFFRLKKWFFGRLSRSSKETMKGKSFIHNKQNMNVTLLEEQEKWLSVKTVELKSLKPEKAGRWQVAQTKQVKRLN